MVEISTMGRAAQLPSHMRCSWGGRASHCRRGSQRPLCMLRRAMVATTCSVPVLAMPARLWFRWALRGLSDEKRAQVGRSGEGSPAARERSRHAPAFSNYNNSAMRRSNISLMGNLTVQQQFNGRLPRSSWWYGDGGGWKRSRGNQEAP